MHTTEVPAVSSDSYRYKRAYSPRPPYSLHTPASPPPSLPQLQVCVSTGLTRSHSNSPLDVSDIQGAVPSYIKRAARPTRNPLNVADIPGTQSRHAKFESRRGYNNPVDPVYYWGDGV